MSTFQNETNQILGDSVDFNGNVEKSNSMYIFELCIRRGNHGPLNKTTRSIYTFSVDYRDLTIENLQNHIRKKVEEAISDADKTSTDYKYYDIHKVRILSSLKKPIKDNPFLDSFTNESLRTVCSTIKQRRKSQNIKLDISVSSTPQSKKDRVSLLESSKIDPVVPDSSLTSIQYENPLPVNLEAPSTLHSIPYVPPVPSSQSSIPIGTVYQDMDYVPIRAKIQTNELNYNGTILLNREDLFRVLGVVNFQQYSMPDHNP